EAGGRGGRSALENGAGGRGALRRACGAGLRHIGQGLSRGTAAGERPGPVTRLLVFGGPRLEMDGRTVPASAWRAQRAFQMLIYLALHPRGASRDELLESFWPGRQAAAG